MTSCRDYLEEHQERFLHDVMSLLRIPSVSALPEHRADVARAADWVADRLGSAGIPDVQVVPTPGHPAVIGRRMQANDKPTVLIYGHYDTQPADPVDAWATPPFDPVVTNGRIYGRGATDDKGGMLIPVFAAEAVLARCGDLPVNVIFLFEGEEEIGSPSLPALLEAQRDLLRCDVVVSADGGQYSEDQPQLIIGCRGLLALQIDVRGPSVDLHSGLHGGAVQNPLAALVQILASMRDFDGRIVVAGFHDGVRPVLPEDRQVVRAVPWDDATYRTRVGVTDLFGEAGYTAPERISLRPTLELNGIWGGFTGEGMQTVIPSEAHVKVSCRLVPDQEPEAVIDCITEHVERYRPPGVQTRVQLLATPSRPYRMPTDHPANSAARAALAEVYGRQPHVVYGGASLPICELFLRELGVYTVFLGFGLDDENMHAPNEFLRIKSFRRGQAVYCRLFQRLAERTHAERSVM